MKKIMFSERYGLRSAVINGCKNMTRRNATALNHPNVCDISEWSIDKKGKAMLVITYDTGLQEVVYPHFQIGEVVAISQPYETFMSHDELCVRGLLTSAAAHNSMFVKAEYMPLRICITNIKVERLQDISEEDAMREGVFKYDKPPLHHEADMFAPWPPYIKPYKLDSNNLIYRCTARYAFAYLIEKISGKGTWDLNPWVFAYEFELVK